MKRISIQRTSTRLLVACVPLFAALTTAAQDKDRGREKPGAAETTAAAQAIASKSDELSAQSKEVLAWTNDFGKEVTQVIDGWINSGAVTQERLFSYLYYPIPDTDPTKFTTDYDSLADRDLQAVLEKYLAKSNLLIYAIATDRNGYAPVHNRQYSQPMTGNRAVDLVNNRAKRMFGDQIGFHAARSQKPYLLQSYARDTGEYVADLSVPVIIRGRHWGCVRIGYRQVDRQQ